jgi:16S rRNA (cytidine1402-2'-O)-methyltransferase
MSGRLYLMPNALDFGTPIAAVEGSLQAALPLQAIERAAKLTHWVVENAKTTRAFLKRVHAVVPLAQPLQSLSIIELPRAQKGGGGGGGTSSATSELSALLAPVQQGIDVGLISEAGLPAVADPGAALVQAAHRLGLQVVPLSGPSSLMLALAASGLNGQSFAFVGYLPIEPVARAARIKVLELASEQAVGQTQLIIETPYRNSLLLSALLSQLKKDTWLSVSCGLTLPEAWSRTDRVADWQAQPQLCSAITNDVPAVFLLMRAR